MVGIGGERCRGVVEHHFLRAVAANRRDDVGKAARLFRCEVQDLAHISNVAFAFPYAAGQLHSGIILAMDLYADDWGRARAAQRLVPSDPDLLLEALRELQSIAQEIKYDTLHEIAKALTLASIAHPTLAECRAAIGATDEEPRSHREWLKVPAPPDIDERLVAFILEVLGSSTEQTSRTAKPLPFERPACAGNAAQIETKDTWSVKTRSSTIAIEQTHSYFGGDVNQPESESTHFTVEGKRRSGYASVRLFATVGRWEASIRVEAPLEERDRIQVAFWRTFA